MIENQIENVTVWCDTCRSLPRLPVSPLYHCARLSIILISRCTSIWLHTENSKFHLFTVWYVFSIVLLLLAGKLGNIIHRITALSTYSVQLLFCRNAIIFGLYFSSTQENTTQESWNLVLKTGKDNVCAITINGEYILSDFCNCWLSIPRITTIFTTTRLFFSKHLWALCNTLPSIIPYMGSVDVTAIELSSKE